MRVSFILLFVLLHLKSNAQLINEPCGFNLLTNIKSLEVNTFEANLQIELVKMHLQENNSNTDISIIPVVVHVIHNGGVENISDSQIRSQIIVLNNDFRKIKGTIGDGAGVDTKVQFCLAKISPNGKCTNGIVRIKSVLTNHQTYQRGLLKDLSFWDPAKYLNIYIVNTINGGILGYSSFPNGPDDADGVVIRDDAFGTIGTVISPNHLGRTLTHEIGHWFGLYHTFQDGCGVDVCLEGDKVCDTPPVANPNFGCPNINSCNNDFPNINDQIANYLDYSEDACKSMFTAGQTDRMHGTLNIIRTNIWSSANLIATGCDSDYIAPIDCSVVADFTVAQTDLCSGSVITFINRSLNTPTNYLWTFVGGIPSSSTSENPAITYSNPGVYEVKLKIWNSTSEDSLIKVKYITVSAPSTGAALGINEGFEDLEFPTNGIIINNPDGGVTWQRTELASFTGVASARINNLINTNYGQSDELILPSYNFKTFLNIPYLRFNWAYARSDANYSDELIVLASKDCGLNWQQVFYRTGSNLVTGPTQKTEYIPDSTTVWKKANINLNAYANLTNVILKIVNVTDGGNCLYIDNVNMGDTSTASANKDNINERLDWQIYPNPCSDFFILKSEMNLKGSSLSIMNAQSQIYENIVLTEDRDNKIQLTNNLPYGIYFIILRIQNKFVYKKLLKYH